MTTIQKRFLGKGLEAVLRCDNIDNVDTRDEVLESLSIDDVQPGKHQPRIKFDPIELEKLVNSIKRDNVLQPVLVRPIESGYELISGERRWRAARLAGFKTIPAIIRPLDDRSAFIHAVIENIQREDLTPIEEAKAFLKFQEEFDFTHEEIGQIVGKSRATVTNAIRLLSLPNSIQKIMEEGKLEAGHARSLLTLSVDKQEFFTNEILKKKLTVRETERLVQSHKKPSNIDIKNNPYADQVKNWVELITKSLSSKTSIKINAKGEGKLTLYFSDPSEMDWLANKLSEKQ